MVSAIQLSAEILEKIGVTVNRLETDSRAVQAGDTFVAYPGEKSDGRAYISQAISKGANAVIWEAQGFSWSAEWSTPNIGVPNLRDALGYIADATYSSPSKKLWMVGVTGTNGKTSSAHWIARSLNEAGKSCALIGTLGNGFVGELQPSVNTTPGASQIQALLAEYLSQGARAIAMEVSSHALAQGRVNGVVFDVALLTNLSRDHLDYHSDMQSYANSKRKLFQWNQLKFAILNFDDEFGRELALQVHKDTVEVIAYGFSRAAVVHADQLGLRIVSGRILDSSGNGLLIEVDSSWGKRQLSSPLVGHFNAENLLGVLAVLLVSGVEMNAALETLGRCQPVAGRMQRLGIEGQPAVIVDYAHTPDALEKVLQTLKEISVAKASKLICVFGCGGDRDAGKRSVMGAIAERLSDYCIVTTDNPRSESPHEIIADVLSGMSSHQFEAIENRTAAIQRALNLAQPRDIVLVAGKGHENYQEIKGVKHPYSDVHTVNEVLKTWRSGVQA